MLSWIRKSDPAEEISYLENNNCENLLKKQFKHLAPVDDADSGGVYLAALDYAIENPTTRNIAITGPYGAGKSSIIKTYQKKSDKYQFLNISLAAFNKKEEEKDKELDEILIERSILQQMLYSATASELPYSRFKRISVPRKLPLFWKALGATIWLFSLIYLYKSQNYLPHDYIFYSRYVGFFLALIVFSGVVYSFFYGYSSLRPSIKKLSMINAELELGEVPENSILNRYLDEIIYFFQVKKYDVVVFEDLDRLNSHQIFVKLREINQLINSDNLHKNRIKFLYALRDDVFSNQDRTKFFDFIIPVVPVINSSNSLDKLADLLGKTLLKEKINKQFLREVSLYIDDYRLMQNIINETLIYFEKINSKNMNADKLLAMMFYKNIYPEDFEKLHHGEGVLFFLCNQRTTLIKNNKESIESDIRILEKEIADREENFFKNTLYLKKIVIGDLSIRFGNAIHQIYIDNRNYSVQEFLNAAWPELFNLEIQEVMYAVDSYGNSTERKHISDWLDEIFIDLDLNEKIRQIEEDYLDKNNSLKNKIKDLEKDSQRLSRMRLQYLLEKDSSGYDSVIQKCNENKFNKKELFVYLIRNGYLDETYHLYTSNFYVGRLSINDQDYLLSVRNLAVVDPKQPLDNVAEVCENLRQSDFEEKYVLNIRLIDYLLSSNSDLNKKRLSLAIEYILSNFYDSQNFFTAYWLEDPVNNSV